MKKIFQGFHEVVGVSVWAFKLYFSFAPFYTLLFVFTQILLSSSAIITSYLLGVAVDQVIKGAQTSTTALQLSLVFLPLIVFQSVMSLVGILQNHASRMLNILENFRLREYLYRRLKVLGITKLEDPDVVNYMYRFNESIGFMGNHLSLLTRTLSSAISLATTVGVILVFIPRVLPLVFLASIVEWSINQHFLRKIWQFSLENTVDRRSAMQDVLALSDPNPLKELLIVGGVNFFERRYGHFVNKYVKKYRGIRNHWTLFLGGNELLQIATYTAGIFLVVEKFLLQAISIGQLTFLFRSLNIFVDSFTGFGGNLVNLRESSIKLADSRALFVKFEPEVDGTIELAVNRSPEIEFKDVDFTYPHAKRKIFRKVSFKIKSGEKIAIVGENGAGKTTLVKLLSRLYRIDSGEILIDGVNLNDIKINSWYENLGVLFQDYSKFGHLTVHENIALGRGDVLPDFEKIKKAATDSESIDFINMYSKKFNQVLSEQYPGGIRPSTGQWQKIAVARFFYREAPVLVLDEPTASIDAVSESRIFNNIYKFMKGKTVIIISHRFSTVRNADRIFVVDKGHIVEQGSHEELLKKNGTYAKAFQLQAEGYE